LFAAVDRQRDSVDVAREVAGEEDGRSRDFLGSSQAAGGNARHEAAQTLRIVASGLRHRRLDDAGRNRVDADSIVAEVGGHRLREHLDGALRRRIADAARQARERSTRGNVDHAAACPAQGRQKRVQRVEGAEVVHLHQAPRGFVHTRAVHGFANHQPGVVHQHLEVADVALHVGRKAGTGLGVRHVERERPR
jgi:hypothetical protein